MTEGLFHLATKVKPPPPPHKFGEARRVPAASSQTGFEQIEKLCPACGLIRITVMQNGGRREWRWHDGEQFIDWFAPECVPIGGGGP